MWRWDGISMDFITKLPKTPSGHDMIWVIIDRLTKSAHFMAIREADMLERLAAFVLRKLSLGMGCQLLSYRITTRDLLPIFGKLSKLLWELIWT
jgi:hypothetical protein